MKIKVVSALIIIGLIAAVSWWLRGPAGGSLADQPHYLYALYGDAKTGELRNPMGVTVSPDGRIFVADTGNAQIQVFKSNGKSSLSIGKGQLNYPLGLAYKDGKVYVADSNLNKVFVFDDQGKALAPLLDNLRLPGSGAAVRPAAVATGPDDLFYIADIADQAIVVVDAGGKLIRQFGSPGSGPGQFQYPNGLWVDREGKVYVADSNNGRIEIFDKDGRFLSQITNRTAADSGGLTLPRGLAVTPEGYIIVVDVFSNKVFAFDTSGRQVWNLGSEGKGNGQFNLPNGLCLDNQGRVYVTDRENNRVEVFGN